ncbi:hypothetical protein C7M56_18380 [Clostridium botulinum]|uniref:Reverse transcriptase domain-containing protein n=1 Tax=Clostridium botulinum TaxID=1491 RepID=A0ABC8D139_CLOBO|nr:hypothetical protein [Clostridium botulinum]AVQ40529.1 hypothetical protein C7M56_18380 [Clostridium botulinum]
MLRERLLSDKNIFLSIYLVDSYIQNKELLSQKERKTLNNLRDVFNVTNIEKTIKKVRARLAEMLNNELEYFEVAVYFKPKKYEDGQTVFRPLHTASLIDQIAMIAMLQILVYDIDTETGKLMPSELSRLLPSNFYGNRIAFDGNQLFKPWQEQYQEYTTKANEMLYNYCENLEYKYEVSLDLENFFPSINPQVLYNFISTHLPLKLNSEDSNTTKTILKKLLIFKLCDLKDIELSWYLKQDINDYTKNSKSFDYAKGMPQGLPHTYFMANIFMLLVRDKYTEVFPGEMLFYVDDSVIFTNGKDGYLNENTFELSIAELNESIKKKEGCVLTEGCEANSTVFPPDYCYQNEDYGVIVHGANSKSVFASIKEAKKSSGEMYLKSLSRETSNIGFDIFTTFSDEEVRMVLSRTEAILSAIHKELDKIKKDDSNQKVYRDKLLRYKKFFAYRKTVLEYKNTGKVEELKEEIIANISLRNSPIKIQDFFEKYSDDILASSIEFVFKRCTDEWVGVDDLIKAVKDLNATLYAGCSKHSYILKAYDQYLKKTLEYCDFDLYVSLRDAVSGRYRTLRDQSVIRKRKRFSDDLDKICVSNSQELFAFLRISKVYDYSEYVRNNSNNLERMILNAMFSYLFEYETDDRFSFAKKSRIPIQYSEIRVLAMLRNRIFSYSDFWEKYRKYTQDEFVQTADYSLLQVIDIFRLFVVCPEQIDSLILIHKYCCDTWKNGSKYLHFYTLHNQEHAVSLIRTSIQLLHAISYFKLKQIDYFVLFAACYLHDISMVTLPDISKFYTGNNEDANLICTEFIEELDINNSTRTKRALCEVYKKIDAFFEYDIRSNHANDSAKEIRTFKELDFIEPTMREIIARVSNGHGYDSTDVYFEKSVGKSALINEKFIKILLRLSDLLDMSRYRISKVILNHNLTNLNMVSRFHWISHLITDGYNLDTEYRIAEISNDSMAGAFLKKGSIVEKMVLTVDVLMSQTTEVPNTKKCNFISNSDLDIKKNGKTTIRVVCDKDSTCKNQQCNFLCKWFVTKNNYLFEELGALKQYLNNIQDNFFAAEMEVNIRVVANTNIPNEVFDYLREYVNHS